MLTAMWSSNIGLGCFWATAAKYVLAYGCATQPVAQLADWPWYTAAIEQERNPFRA